MKILDNILLNKVILLIFFYAICYSSSFGQFNFEWAESFGTNKLDYFSSMTIDSSDNILIAGTFRDSIDLDTSDFGGSGLLKNDRVVSGFISKYNPDGTLKWAKQIKGRSGQDISNYNADSTRINITSIAVDVSGNVYIVGAFTGLVDFNPDENTSYYLTNPIPPYFNDGTFTTYGQDAFILKLDENGNFQWARQVGGQNFTVEDQIGNLGTCVKVDKNNDVYVVGTIVGNGASFKEEDGTSHPVGNSGLDENGYKKSGMFILKLTDQGEYSWSKNIPLIVQITQANSSSNSLLAIDKEGDLLIGGTSWYAIYDTIDFDPGPGKYLQPPVPIPNEESGLCKFSFVLKLNSLGEFVWVAVNKGAQENTVKSIITDLNGNVYYIGGFGYTDYMDTGFPFNFDANPDENGTEYLTRENSHIGTFQNVYLVKLDSNRNFVFAKNIGGHQMIDGFDLKLNSKNEIFISGRTTRHSPFDGFPAQTDFDPDLSTQFLSATYSSANEYIDVLFVLKLNEQGSFQWVRQFGNGGGFIGSNQLAINKKECNIYLAGAFGDGGANLGARDFDPNPTNTSLLTTKGLNDVFLARFSDYTFSKPTITAVGSLGFCPGDSVILQATDSLPNYQWSPTGETTKTITVQETGKYALSTDYGCVITHSDTISVNLFSTPQITEITPSSGTTIKQGEQVQIIVSATNGNSYSWTPNSTLSCNDCLSPIAKPDSSTNYCITIMSLDSCKATECVKINIEPVCMDIFVPNAFSPNGDGNNDVLELQTKPECVTDFNLQIYDRWGEKVFEGLKVTDTWDGMFDGKNLDNAVFVYQMKYKTIDSVNYKTKKGNVSIIK